MCAYYAFGVMYPDGMVVALSFLKEIVLLYSESKSLRFYGTSLDVENFLKGYCVLVSSGNYTHVEILTGNS